MISWAFCIMEDVTLQVIAFLLCFFLKGHLTYGSDRIHANQSLSGAQTIISASGNFKLGFFNPGNPDAANFKTGNYYLGIWYNNNNIIESNDAVVWVANRLKPMSNKTSTLKILDGNLVILNGYNESIWSTNITTHGSKNLVVVLRDDGNLVLTNVSNLDMEPPFWQSFDHPGNTWLPGAKISFNRLTNTKQILTSWKNDEDPAPGSYSVELDIYSSQLIMRWNRSQQYWNSGSWNDGFSLGETKLDYHFIFFDNGNDSYFTYLMNDFSTMARFVMRSRGQLNQYVQEALISSEPSELCQVYAFCGAFGFCDKSLPLDCGCLPGFGLESYNGKPLQDFSGGCSRQIPLQCGNNSSSSGKRDDFRMIPNTYLAEPSIILTDVSHAGCEATCLSNCSCTAYSYDNGGCSTWNSALYDLGQYKAGEPERTIYIRLASSEFSSQRSKRAISITPIIIGAVMLVFLVILLVVVWRWVKLRSKISKAVRGSLAAVTSVDLQTEKRPKKAWIGEFFYSAFNEGRPTSGASKPEWSDIPIFTFNIIQEATDSFSVANKLGEGGFGQVFKGKLPNGQEIAVKRLSRTSGQGVEEFKNEVTLISKVQHRNLVRLLGFCIKGEERLLVYEFMPNKGLDSFIFGPASLENRTLDWGSRINIIEGIARGLLYLHRDSRLKIIHRDLKASNILLDEHMIPRISDFGMARMVRIDQSAANTNRVVGTYGYMSPEYALQGMFSVKSDVFSFGVLLLEIVSGKRNTGFYDCETPQNLLGYAWQLWEEDKAFELLNPNLADSCNATQVYRCIHVALLCVQEHVNDRPTMSEVVFMLCNDTNLTTPKKPAFCWAGRTDGSTPLLNHEAVDESRNEISVSSVYGR